MKQYELRVARGSRLLIGILIISLSFLGLFMYGSKNHSFIFMIAIIPLIIGFILLGFAKMILKFSNGRIEIDWEKRFLYDDKSIEPINVNDIKILVVDDHKFLRKIITDDRIIEVNNVKPVKEDFVIFIDDLISIVLKNNGRIMSSKQYFWEYDNYAFFVVSLAVSLFLISRLWEFISYYTLFLLIIPLITFIVQKRKERKKAAQRHI